MKWPWNLVWILPSCWVGGLGVAKLNLGLTASESALPVAIMLPIIPAAAWAGRCGYYDGTDQQPWVRRMALWPAWFGVAVGMVWIMFLP